MTRKQWISLIPLTLVGLVAWSPFIWDGIKFVRAYNTPQATEARGRRAYREELAHAVVEGQMSFEEAGCHYRGGNWNFDSRICEL